MTDVQLPRGSGTSLQVNTPALDEIGHSLITINGVGFPIEGAVPWGYKSGVAPQAALIRTQNRFADEIVDAYSAGGNTATLTLGGADNQEANRPQLTKTFQKLVLLPQVPQDHAHDGLQLRDDRWRWDRPKVTRTYNLLRKTNDLVAFEGQVNRALEGALIAARQAYVPHTIILDESLEPLRPYTALDIVLDILKNWLGYEDDQIVLEEAASSAYIPPNQILEGEPANAALERFLKLSENSLYIDEDGRVVIYARAVLFDGAKFDELIAPALPALIAGDMRPIDRRAIRPIEILEYFIPETEQLLTFRSFAATETIAGGEVPADNRIDAGRQIQDQRIYLENVTRTIVNDQIPGKPRGTIVSIEEALDAFSDSINGPTGERFTLDEMHEYYGGGTDATLPRALGVAGDLAIALLDGETTSIYQAIYKDFRTLFQIPHYVRDALSEINPLLSQIVFEESRLRLPSEVFSTLTWGVNLRARVDYDSDDIVTLDSFETTPYKPVPATLSIEDADLGLIRVTNQRDLNHPGAINEVIPGEIQEKYRTEITRDNFVHGDVGSLRAHFMGAHGLERSWEMSAVVSVTLLIPNDNGRLVAFSFESEDAEAEGPQLQILNTYDTARFSLPDILEDYRNPSAGSDIFVNRRLCEELAAQDAKRRYNTFSDQVEGSATFAWSGPATEIRPYGAVNNITYSYGSDGKLGVTVTAKPIATPVDIRNIVPEDVLRSVFRQVDLSSGQGGQT